MEEEKDKRKDKRLECMICRADFWFSNREQEFYRERGLDKPRRCPLCRQRKRSIREEIRLEEDRREWNNENG